MRSTHCLQFIFFLNCSFALFYFSPCSAFVQESGVLPCGFPYLAHPVCFAGVLLACSSSSLLSITGRVNLEGNSGLGVWSASILKAHIKRQPAEQPVCACMCARVCMCASSCVCMCACPWEVPFSFGYFQKPCTPAALGSSSRRLIKKQASSKEKQCCPCWSQFSGLLLEEALLPWGAELLAMSAL